MDYTGTNHHKNQLAVTSKRLTPMPSPDLSINNLTETDARVTKVLVAVSYCAVLVLLGIGAKSWHSGHEIHGAVLFLFSLLVLINTFAYHVFKSYKTSRNIFVFLISLLFLYLTCTGGEHNTGPLWFYVFPPFLFYLANMRVGVILSILMLISIAIIFRFPELPFVVTQYGPDFQVRFLTSLTFVTFFTGIMEYSRRNARQELVHMAQLYERVSRTDELTQLANRRDMQHHLEKEFSRFKRHGHHFSVILLDVDHFKAINDTYGHDAGDHVLVEIARILRKTSRELDLAARWGGEEFMILLPNTPLLHALKLAERVRNRIEHHVISYKGQSLRATASCGVCSITQTKDLKQLLIQADLNLYQAKERGRNQVIPPIKPHQDDLIGNDDGSHADAVEQPN